MALSAKLSNEDYRVYTLLGDGEIQEGQVWEAAMLASHRKLDNLVVIVDNNGLQIDGAIDEVCSPYPIDKKFEAFNFHVINVDGHDFDALDAAFKEARADSDHCKDDQRKERVVYGESGIMAWLCTECRTICSCNGRFRESR